jgi:hypothetical protein
MMNFSNFVDRSGELGEIMYYNLCQRKNCEGIKGIQLALGRIQFGYWSDNY